MSNKKYSTLTTLISIPLFIGWLALLFYMWDNYESWKTFLIIISVVGHLVIGGIIWLYIFNKEWLKDKFS